MDFAAIADLRLLLREVIDRHTTSLNQYYDKETGGFYHRHDQPTPGKFSKSSTATCVLSLLATGAWHTGPWKATGAALLGNLLRRGWEPAKGEPSGSPELPPGSAGLPPGNPFTGAWLLDAVTALLRLHPEQAVVDDHAARIDRAQQILVESVSTGGARIQGYPQSAYVTQLVTRVLNRRGVLESNPALVERIREWSEREMHRQLGLLKAGHKTGDPFQVAYSVVLIASLVPEDQAGPDDEVLLEAALAEFFRHQRPDGTWPLSRSLFHYPKVGSAHCFDYELLVEMLEVPRLSEKLLGYLEPLGAAARALRGSAFQLPKNGWGWSSGHHPQLRGPESWSTASVYHFAHALERLVARQVRHSTFAYLGAKYTEPPPPDDYRETLTQFLDCELTLQGAQSSLKEILSAQILAPLVAQEKLGTIASGRPLPKDVPMSMIFFGPPGTSKTRLAAIIAQALGWPLLSIDPSHFVRNGLDGVYAESNHVFSMLAIAERIVVLLDEFDEMVRERGGAADVLSRFLTTAMLPKIIKINENRRVVFIVATNHIEAFDVAISRPGRFDVILQVMPPTAAEKRRHWQVLEELQQATKSSQIDSDLKPLTYAECEILVRKLANTPDRVGAIRSAAEDCLLNSPYSTSENSTKATSWAQICEQQADKSRLI
jgi:hypothetical protein